MVVGFHSFSFPCQGRLQWAVAEFHSGQILAHIGKSVQRKVMFKIPGFCALCSVLWKSPELQQLLQECPNRDLIKSPAPELLCSPGMIMIWKMKEKGMAWENPFFEGLLQALGNRLGSAWLLWNGKKFPSKRECPVSSVAAAPHMWNVRVPGWPCPVLMLPGCLWAHRLANSPGGDGNCPTVPVPDVVAFLLHHCHCRAAPSVVQSRRSPWLSHAENQAPYPQLLLLSLHVKKRGLISKV